MAKTFTIQPGDQSLVGKKIRDVTWDKDRFREVSFVGKEKFMGTDNDGNETAQYFLSGLFEFYEEPKKNVLMALAICRGAYGRARLSDFLYPSEEAARDGVLDFVSWPAIPNKYGFYEVLG